MAAGDTGQEGEAALAVILILSPGHRRLVRLKQVEGPGGESFPGLSPIWTPIGIEGRPARYPRER